MHFNKLLIQVKHKWGLNWGLKTLRLSKRLELSGISTNKPCTLFCKSLVEKMRIKLSAMGCSFKTNLALLRTHLQVDVCGVWFTAPLVCEICSNLTIKTPEWRHWRRSGGFIGKSEHILHFFLVFLLLTLNKYAGYYHNNRLYSVTKRRLRVSTGKLSWR